MGGLCLTEFSDRRTVIFDYIKNKIGKLNHSNYVQYKKEVKKMESLYKNNRNAFNKLINGGKKSTS